MKNKLITQIEKKLENEVMMKKPGEIKFEEIVDIVRATTTFNQVISVMCGCDKNITVFDLKNNSKSMTNIYINSFRLNDRTAIK